jgi:DNA invertase Pin-like site-specific DNA recombinase
MSRDRRAYFEGGTRGHGGTLAVHQIELTGRRAHPTLAVGRGFIAMMSAMAQDERLRIVKRTHEGRQIARANGLNMGRKPILNPHQIKEARQRLARGETTRDLAKISAMSRSTIARLA